MNTSQSSMNSPEEPLPGAASPDEGGPGWSRPAKFAFMFTGVLLPIICFAIGFREFFAAYSRHQGNWYAKTLLCHKQCVPFYPFLLYSITCMTLLVFAPGRFSKNFVVRFGVYTGALLALQYWVVFMFAVIDGEAYEVVMSGAGLSFGAVFVPLIVAWLMVGLARESRNFRKGCAWCVAVNIPLSGAIFLAMVFLQILNARPVSDILMICFFLFCVFPCVLLLHCATPWAVVSYTAMAIYAARHSGVKRLQFTLAQLLWAVTWLAAYLAAWRTAVALIPAMN